mmetsp:Transcript_12845/g.46959  ORF Transcript_12845/g.46959 Transcript_12845/m.46959 type:complete len:93 (+) Transcript_12845:159-437(+)
MTMRGLVSMAPSSKLLGWLLASRVLAGLAEEESFAILAGCTIDGNPTQLDFYVASNTDISGFQIGLAGPDGLEAQVEIIEEGLAIDAGFLVR